MKYVFSVISFLLTIRSMNLQKVPYKDLDKDCAINNTNFITKTGKCIEDNYCINYGLFPSNKTETIEICGSNPHISQLCCPLLEEDAIYRSLTSKAVKKCWEYQSQLMLVVYLENTTTLKTGRETIPKEFPHMAAIGYGKNDSVEWLCGGSLISENFVLTAAHCAELYNLNASTVRLGELESSSPTKNATFRDIPISEIIVHPLYIPNTHYNDIALLKLSRQPIFSDYIRPACLHTNYDVPKQLEAIGWGKREFIGFKSDKPVKTTLNVSDFQTCFEEYEELPSRGIPISIEDATQICAGGNYPEDTCQVDSGGSLHYTGEVKPKFKSYHVIAGITSFGYGCGFSGTPGVFTRVSAYVSWIESIVWP